MTDARFPDGAGLLSAEATARLARGVGDPDLALPAFARPEAVARWRAAIHRAWGEGTEGDEPEHRPVTVAGRPALRAGPGADRDAGGTGDAGTSDTGTGDASATTVLYLHGGGYALGSAGVAAPITARLATRLSVVSLDYRLAPEHPYPAALDDAFAAYRALRTQLGRHGRLAVAGDSAGGGLAVAVAFRAQAAGVAAPDAIVAFCPHLAHDPDPDVDADADAAQQAGPVRLAAAYRGGAAPTDPYLSPLHAEPARLAALPPTLVQSGTADPLHRQAIRFARRARAAGAPVTLDLWEGLWHTWQYHRKLPEADQAISEAVRFLERPCR